MNRRRYLLRFKQDRSVNSKEIFPNERRYYKIGENTIDEETVDYVQTVTSLIEGRYITQEEILAMLEKKERQLSMVKQKKMDYAVKYLKGKPP